MKIFWKAWDTIRVAQWWVQVCNHQRPGSSAGTLAITATLTTLLTNNADMPRAESTKRDWQDYMEGTPTREGVLSKLGLGVGIQQQRVAQWWDQVCNHPKPGSSAALSSAGTLAITATLTTLLTNNADMPRAESTKKEWQVYMEGTPTREGVLSKLQRQADKDGSNKGLWTELYAYPLRPPCS